MRQRLGDTTDCRLGYAANHDEFERVPFWDDLDDIGVDAYFPLASTWEAKGRSRPRENVLMRRSSRNLKRLKEFSDKRRKRVTISEWGTVPFELTSTKPWDWQPSQIPDVDEQVRTYSTLLRSIESEGSWLSACDLWHWRMPGNGESPYGIDHTSEVASPANRWESFLISLDDLDAKDTIIFKINWSHATGDLSGPIYLADASFAMPGRPAQPRSRRPGG